MEFLSKNSEETAKIAIDFASSLKPDNTRATVVGLYGELGAGKTTFMKFLAEFFGVEESIQSPTFVIMKKYKTSPPLEPTSNLDNGDAPLSLTRRGGTGGEVFNSLIHIDAYRIESEAEMLNLGWKEIIADPNNLICIEWPERILGIMPEHTKIFFEHARPDDSVGRVSENERKITIKS